MIGQTSQITFGSRIVVVLRPMLVKAHLRDDLITLDKLGSVEVPQPVETNLVHVQDIVKLTVIIVEGVTQINVFVTTRLNSIFILEEIRTSDEHKLTKESPVKLHELLCAIWWWLITDFDQRRVFFDPILHFIQHRN